MEGDNMQNKIYDKVKNRIDDAKEGTIFVTSDFADIANITTIRKYLGRQVAANSIVRIMNGVYEKPKYSKLLKEFVPADPEKVAYAIARNYHWTIAPCGDVALNKLGLSTQVPVVWSYISDGPYRGFSCDNIKITFKHRTNREISKMTEITSLAVETIKSLGKERIDNKVITQLKNKLSEIDKSRILKEATGVSEWIYEILRKVCI